MNAIKIWILMPAYNEEACLPSLLPKIQKEAKDHNWNYTLVACNDGSTDKTGEILAQFQKEMPIEIITHEINRGLGETARDLFEYAAKHSNDEDVIVRIESDDTNEPMYITRLREKLSEGYDVVTCSRFQEGSGQMGVYGYRKIISLCATMFMRFFFPVKNLKEYTCGYRAYRATIIKKAIATYGNMFIQLKGLGFTCTLEKIVKLNILGATFAEVPFVLRYDQKASESKMVSSITMLGYIVMTICHHWPWGGWRTKYKQLPNKNRS